MELPWLHKQRLFHLCRLCGESKNVHMTDRKPYDKLAYKLYIQRGLDLDLTTDDPWIHPPYICNLCRQKLQIWWKKASKKKKATLNISLKTFKSHDLFCSVCSVDLPSEEFIRPSEKHAEFFKTPFVMSTDYMKIAECDRVPVRPKNETIKGESYQDRNIIDAMTASNQTMERIPKIHTGEAPVSYMECSNFSVSSNLTEDKRVNTGETSHSYMECSNFSVSSNLTVDRRVNIHVGEQSYIYTSTESPAASLQSNSTKQHEEKPFSCTQCSASFSHLWLLKRHFLVHTGEKPYSCTECGVSFSRPHSLKKHMMIHTGGKPYCCTQCGVSFSQSYNLKQHMRVHTGEKPFSCTECSATFSQSANLKHHMRIHTGERPYNTFSFKCEHSHLNGLW